MRPRPLAYARRMPWLDATWDGLARIARSKVAESRKLAPSTRNALPGFRTATTKPPRAGPISRIISGRTRPCNAFACGSRSAASRSGTMAVEAGLKKASPAPTKAMSAMMCQSWIAPVTDNKPFFFFTLKTGQVLRHEVMHSAIDWKVNLGIVVLGMVLLISIVAVGLFLLLPLALHGGSRGLTLPLLYFVAIGLGYILVEIAFIQRFVLFLGHPTYALTVVIFLLLLSSGAGSLASRNWLSDPARVRRPLAIITVAILAYVLLLPSFSARWSDCHSRSSS